MNNFGSDGFPGRSNRSGFNDASSSLDEGRGAPPPTSFSNANGILARPPGIGSDALSSGLRAQQQQQQQRQQQPNHEVMMVREASRPNHHPITVQQTPNPINPSFDSAAAADRLPFTGAPPDPLHLTDHSNRNTSTSVSNRHHRNEHRSEKENKQQLIVPKMLKIAVIGESTSGKTAICNAITSEGYSFSRNYHMTTGVTIFAKSVKLPTKSGTGAGSDNPDIGTSYDRDGGGGDAGASIDDVLESRINLVLVDSAGKPLYRELLPQYWDQLDGLALVIDLTSSTALESATGWLSLAKECLVKQQSTSKSKRIPDDSGDHRRSTGAGVGTDHSPILGVLIGTKSDLKEQRVISPKSAQDFASQQGLQYFECSAKENNGMEEPFFYLAHQWATSSTTSTSSTSNAPSNSSGKEGAPAPSGGIFPPSNNPTRRSAFATRQNSSEAF